MSENKTTPSESPQYLNLVNLYLAGDSAAVLALDTAVTAALDLATAREKSEWEDEEMSYLDVRQEIDEDIDSLFQPFTTLGLVSSRFATNK